jgi:hypothetical protein
MNLQEVLLNSLDYTDLDELKANIDCMEVNYYNDHWGDGSGRTNNYWDVDSLKDVTLNELNDMMVQITGIIWLKNRKGWVELQRDEDDGIYYHKWIYRVKPPIPDYLK